MIRQERNRLHRYPVITYTLARIEKQKIGAGAMSMKWSGSPTSGFSNQESQEKGEGPYESVGVLAVYRISQSVGERNVQV